jgi:hypothetical protein
MMRVDEHIHGILTFLRVTPSADAAIAEIAAAIRRAWATS